MTILDVLCLIILVGMALWVVITNHDNNHPAI